MKPYYLFIVSGFQAFPEWQIMFFEDVHDDRCPQDTDELKESMRQDIALIIASWIL